MACLSWQEPPVNYGLPFFTAGLLAGQIWELPPRSVKGGGVGVVLEELNYCFPTFYNCSASLIPGSCKHARVSEKQREKKTTTNSESTSRSRWRNCGELEHQLCPGGTAAAARCADSSPPPQVGHISTHMLYMCNYYFSFPAWGHVCLFSSCSKSLMVRGVHTNTPALGGCKVGRVTATFGFVSLMCPTGLEHLTQQSDVTPTLGGWDWGGN